MRTNWASFKILVACCVLLTFEASCETSVKHTAPPENPPPQDRWTTYTYTFDLTGEPASPNSVPIAMAVVNAKYKLQESALTKTVYTKVARGFSASMGVDLNRVILAKGMTARGPYADIEDITYKEKENSTLTLYPEVFIDEKTVYLDAGKVRLVYYVVSGQYIYRWEKYYRMKVSGWIAFNMEEPLTHQKMWVKRLNLEEAEFKGRESYDAVPQYGRNPQTGAQTVISYNLGECRYDGKVDDLADYIKNNYTTIMQKCWTYIEPEEELELKKQCNEIRTKAGFSIPK